MRKKSFALLLVFLLCCNLSIPVFPQETTAQGYVILEEPCAANGYTTTISGNPEYLKRLHSTPEAVLSGSTATLLEYFLENFAAQALSCSSTLNAQPLDLSYIPAFKELLTRADLLDALEAHAQSILHPAYDDGLSRYHKAVFTGVLSQPAILAQISAASILSVRYPNLQSMYSTSLNLP